MDQGHPFDIQAQVQQQMHAVEWGVRRGMADADRWKRTYDRHLLSGDLAGFHFLAVRFDGLLPIVCCAGFHVEVDLEGNYLQKLTRGDFELDHLAFNVTAYDGRTIVTFGWSGLATGPAGRFVTSFRSLADDRKADAVVRIAFEQSDNIFMRPSWWGQQTDDQRECFIDQAFSGTPSAARRLDCLVGRGTNHATAEVMELVEG